jgi:hypothetical protein
MLSAAEINQKFGALKEHGLALEAKFKEFVKALDADIPDGVAKAKLVNALETASNWGHHALAEAEEKAQKAATTVAKSGEKPAPVPSDSDAPPVVETPPAV